MGMIGRNELAEIQGELHLVVLEPIRQSGGDAEPALDAQVWGSGSSQSWRREWGFIDKEWHLCLIWVTALTMVNRWRNCGFQRLGNLTKVTL